jgi:tetratricopeptide (TPR) repeat protein
MHSLTRKTESERDEPAAHQTRSWNNLNPPNPNNGSVEQRALRSLLEKKTRQANRKTRLFIYVLPSIVLIATALLAYKSFHTSYAVIADNPTLATPTNGEQFVNRAEALAHLGRYEEALIDYSCTVRLNHDSKRAQEGIALCFVEMGRNTEAIEKLNTILARNPNSITAHMLRAECFRNMHEFDRARADFSWLMQHDKKCSTAYCSMADLLTIEGKREEALLYLDSAIKMNNDNFETRQRRADILVSLGRFEEATRDFEAINRMPDKQENFSTLTSRCKALMATRSYDKALPILDKLVSLRPSQVTLYLERARANNGLKLYSKAIKDCDQVLKSSDANPDALMLRADCYAKLGDKISALHDLEQAAAKNPKSTDVLLKLAAYNMNQANFASALAVYKSALKTDSTSKAAAAGCYNAQRALEKLAGGARNSGGFRTAGASFDEHSHRGAEPDADFKQLEAMGFSELLTTGYSALREGRLVFAYHALKRAVQLQPNSPEPRRYLAFTLMESGDPYAAEEQLKALKLLSHEDASDQIRLATAFHKGGHHQKAIEILQGHVRRHKTDVDAIVLLSDILMSANDRPRAIKLCEQALTIVVSRRDQARLKEKYTALKNVDGLESAGNNQTTVDTSPLESRGS